MQEIPTLTQQQNSTFGTNVQTNFLRLEDERIKKRVEEEKKRIAEKAVALRKKYGDWISDNDVSKIDRVDRANNICSKCKGLPCGKGYGVQNYCQEIYIPEGAQVVYVHNRPCEFFTRLQAQKRIQRNFANCRIPPKYAGKSFDSYTVNKFNEVAVKWAKYVIENPDKGLLLYGGAGVGKTHLAAIIAQELLKKGKSVIFGDVPSILDAMKATFDDKDKTIEKLMEDLTNADVLVLDDIGSQNPTEWSAERLYMVVNNRYNAGKPIIATSNFNADELTRHFKGITGERIVSRLTEMCQPVKIGGLDHRKQ